MRTSIPRQHSVELILAPLKNCIVGGGIKDQKVGLT
jgi:hypothetical protein